MRGPLLPLALRVGAVLGIVAGIAAVYRQLVGVNITTVALSFLLAILAISALWGLAVAIIMSLAAVLAFNFFFLPPVGAFTIRDPQNWVALFAFLIVAVVGSGLSERAKRQAREALGRRREAELLYTFSQRLLGDADLSELARAMPKHLAETFDAEGAALFITEGEQEHRFGTAAATIETQQLRSAALEALAPPPSSAESAVALPLTIGVVRLGVRAEGAFGVVGTSLTPPTREALGSVIAVALERARALDLLARAQATRESERLKSALLDAVAHDFRTPLTAIKAAVTALLHGPTAGEAARQELLQVIDQETDRLDRLVAEASEMAQLEAGQFRPAPSSQPVDQLVRAALNDCRNALGPRPVELNLPPDLPRVCVDPASTRRALVRLLENADQYSPKREPITVIAEPNGAFVCISVADRGPGVAENERDLIFEKFYRGRQSQRAGRGTGLGLTIARAIAEANGGAVVLASPSSRQGSVFTLSLPLADASDSA